MGEKNTPSRKASAPKEAGFRRRRVPGGGGGGRIVPGRNRKVQIVRTGGRKLFKGKAQQVFLEWFAATCNVKWSAEMAGFNYKTVLRHRMNDPHFAEGWDRAVRQGYARLEAKVIETKRKETPIGIEGDWDAPEMDEIDPHLALSILREHKREIAGVKKPGRAPTVATNAEVFDALVKRLRAFGIRVEEEEKREREAKRQSEPDETPPPRAARNGDSYE